jgi:hypothetical protein
MARWRCSSGGRAGVRRDHRVAVALPLDAYRGHGGLVVASLKHRQPAASGGAAAHALAASAKPASAERFDTLEGPVETARAAATEMHASGEKEGCHQWRARHLR